MKSVKKLAGSALVLSTILAGPALAADEQTITTVVKVTGENWFIRMNEGVDAFNADKEAIDATQIGPAQADAAQQARIIEDLVAKGVSAIAVVPMDPSALEGVLRRAQGRGIKVIAHEGDSIVNADADIEAFDNAAFGTKINEGLAECMGGEGKWTTFVGSLGSLTHNQWVDAGAANAEAKYPGMELVAAKTDPSTTPTRRMRRPRKSCAPIRTSRVSRARPQSTSSASAVRSRKLAGLIRPASSAWACPRTPDLTWKPAPSTGSTSGIRRMPAT